MRKILVCALLFGCSTVHGVRPLGKGTVAVEGSLGGPITEVFGAPIPLPLSTLGVAVGVNDRLDVHGAWHPTPALMLGLPAGDLGASVELWPPEGARPRLMGDLTMVMAGGDTVEGSPEGGVRVFLQPTATAGWDWGKDDRHTVYTSLTGFIQPAPTFHVLGAAAVGNRWGAGRSGFTTEVKWIAPFQDADRLVPHYYAPGRQGAISFQLGLQVAFGGAK